MLATMGCNNLFLLAFVLLGLLRQTFGSGLVSASIATVSPSSHDGQAMIQFRKSVASSPLKNNDKSQRRSSSSSTTSLEARESDADIFKFNLIQGGCPHSANPANFTDCAVICNVIAEDPNGLTLAGGEIAYYSHGHCAFSVLNKDRCGTFTLQDISEITPSCTAMLEGCEGYKENDGFLDFSDPWVVLSLTRGFEHPPYEFGPAPCEGTNT